MIELRPALALDEAPLVLGGEPRTRRDAPLRPLIRGALLAALLAAALALPLVRPFAIGPTPRLERPEVSTAGFAAPRKDGAPIVQVRGTIR